MENVIGFFIFSVMMVVIKARFNDMSKEEICLAELLTPTFPECPARDEEEITTLWDADECAFKKIGLLSEDEKLHAAKYFDYLMPHLNGTYYREFLKIEFEYCESIASEDPPVTQYVDLAYRFTTCLWQDRDKLSVVLGCHQ